MRRILAATLLSVFVLAGCQSTKTDTSGAAFNAVCPASGEPVSAEARTVMVGDKAVGFCCNMCADKFEGMDDKAKADAVAKLEAIPTTQPKK